MTHKTNSPYIVSLLAAEISSFSQFFAHTVVSSPESRDSLDLAQQIDCPTITRYVHGDDLKLQDSSDCPSLYVLDKNLNRDSDINSTINSLSQRLNRNDRICFIVINPYFRFFNKFFDFFNLSNKQSVNFVTRSTIHSLCDLNELQILSIKNVAFIPRRFKGLGDFLNSVLPAIPLIRWLSLFCIITARSKRPSHNNLKMSVIVPARNESGNIFETVRLLNLSKVVNEIIFVEGGSKDDTADKIEQAKSFSQIPILSLKQKGTGKADAVKLGFASAQHELLFILDADLTVSPEETEMFYKSYVSGLGDFINGNRLLYPMEENAMKPLNFIGNIFFAKALSYILNIKIGDALCGSKLISKSDYLRVERWRENFGQLDPFGDFDLLFGASSMQLGVFDFPVHYRARSYGETNIRRFRDGFALLKMLLVGFYKLKLGKLHGDGAKIS